MAYSKTTWTDGTTPVDASNLNNIENGISEAGEIPAGYTINFPSTSWIFSGYLTTSSQDLYFTIPLNRSAANRTVSLTPINMTIRGINGYVESGKTDFSDVSSISVAKDSDLGLRIRMTKTDGWNGTNNTPVAIFLSGTITFT